MMEQNTKRERAGQAALVIAKHRRQFWPLPTAVSPGFIRSLKYAYLCLWEEYLGRTQEKEFYARQALTLLGSTACH